MASKYFNFHCHSMFSLEITRVGHFSSNQINALLIFKALKVVARFFSIILSHSFDNASKSPNY